MHFHFLGITYSPGDKKVIVSTDAKFLGKDRTILSYMNSTCFKEWDCYMICESFNEVINAKTS